MVGKGPKDFLARLSVLNPLTAAENLITALRSAAEANPYPTVVEWTVADRRRITMVLPRHWILIRDPHSFRGMLAWEGVRQHCESIEISGQHVAAFAPLDAFRRGRYGKATLTLKRFNAAEPNAEGELLFL